MQDDLVFKPGPLKRAIGGLVFIGAAACVIALTIAFIKNRETQTTADFWSLVVLDLILVGVMLAGIAIQYMRWGIEGNAVVARYPFKTNTFHIGQIGGYGKLIIITNMIPLAHINLFNHDLEPIARLPVTLKDMDRAEAWLAQRVPYVIEDGSPAFPKRRYADRPKV